MCPYMAGGRSRRGSPKAGTTVYIYTGLYVILILPNIFNIVALLLISAE